MASETPTAASSRLACDTGTFTPPPLARYDTVSSTGSAARLPQGNWALNISGVCSTCHRHYKSLQVHVKVSDDSTHVGDVHCTKCRRLWLAFGRVNVTRLSLLSVISTEPHPMETTFHNTLVHMIRSANLVATLSPTLTIIPEATSTGPSRGASVRSTLSRIQGPSTAIGNETTQTIADIATDPPGLIDTSQNEDPIVQQRWRLGKRTIGKGQRALLHAGQKVGARFPTLQNAPLGLGRWFARRESPKVGIFQPEVDRSTSRDSPAAFVSSSPNENTEAPAEVDAAFDMAALNVCTSSATAADALDSLRGLDTQAIQALPPDQRLTWGRQQLTDFRRHYSGSVHRAANPATVNNEAQTNSNELWFPLPGLPTRRHSILAFVGDRFGSQEYWAHNRSSLNISETNISAADTVFDGMSISSVPRNILRESLQPHRRGSGSPRPPSTYSMVQDWSQIHRNRVEARRSIDSTATGGVVRSIIAPRGRTVNRLSHTSMNRVSSIYAAEPPPSRVQVALEEETEHSRESDQPRSPSPSPPIPGTDTTIYG
ncbi:hypothetical protein DDE83_002070 [Stemphylium lycopersici]|uniref:Uncharacterized protein n=1 Tax=Stemphylium lycopersici TaxID=183478 RepID=A0A364NAZ0_STELY|nr:hypothetical protein DDE83_002070 [Stemphylium lycopersici]